MEPPSARMGATLSGSEDGRRLWLFGGNTGGGSVNDLYCLELDTRTWSQVNTLFALPSMRSAAAADLQLPKARRLSCLDSCLNGKGC